MKEIDLYKGFEGEKEMLILSYEVDGILTIKLRLWYGYFSDIVNQIPVNKKGVWEGVPFYYNTLTGWEAGVHWQCEDKELFVSQLENINLCKLDDLTKIAYQELLNLFKEGIENKRKIFFLEE